MGCPVGRREGCLEGCLEGCREGCREGCDDGCDVGMVHRVMFLSLKKLNVLVLGYILID